MLTRGAILTQTNRFLKELHKNSYFLYNNVIKDSVNIQQIIDKYEEKRCEDVYFFVQVYKMLTRNI